MTAPLMPLSDKQVMSLRESCESVNIWEGAIRSGKTIASLLRWLMFVATAPLGGQLVVIARTRDSAYRNVFAPLMDAGLFGELAGQTRYTNGASTATILGRTVFVIGASDAKSEKVLRGLTVAGAYVDEVTVIPEEFFTQLLGRMSVAGAQLFGTTNPDSPAHWFKKKFLDRVPIFGTDHQPVNPLKGWRRFKFVMADNPSLSAEWIARKSAEYTGLWFRRFIQGEWVAAEGAVFPMFDTARHVVAWKDLPPMHRLLAVGMDYGTTNATAAVLLGIAHDHDQYGRITGATLYVVDEWRYDPRVALNGKRLTNSELSAEFRSWLMLPHLPYATALQPERIIVDPAAASFKVQLRADGVAGLVDADNAVSYGIGVLGSLLADGRMRISDRCAGLLEEVPGYSWDDKATEKGEDKPVKVADHSLDAWRYSVVTTESLWRRLLALAA